MSGSSALASSSLANSTLPGEIAADAPPYGLRPMPLIVIALLCMMAAVAVAGFQAGNIAQGRLHDMQLGNRDIRRFEAALVDAESGLQGFVLSGNSEYLRGYDTGTQALDQISPDFLATIDEFARGTADPRPVSTDIASLRAAWAGARALADAQDLPKAQALLRDRHEAALMQRVRLVLANQLAQRDVSNTALWTRIRFQQSWVLVLLLFSTATAIAAVVYAFHRALRDAALRENAVRNHVKAGHQIRLLLVMAEMLQGAADHDDANSVLRGSATQLMPEVDGALYVFNASRDRLDLSTSWRGVDGTEDTQTWPDHIAPGTCWALKRGKAHNNATLPGALRCPHASDEWRSLEIPIVARGEIYGLLELSTRPEGAAERLRAIRPMATAIAETMSLALSGIALREKLRNQALRDPLTGLYNRRFLEEMLERLAADAERRRVSLSAIMLDLDHFKLLNDKFGHATGDAVLRQASAVISAHIRAVDVACRYGGEEIALLLPDCDLAGALAIAEEIRGAIAAAGQDGRLPAVTASLGVACVPETGARSAELLQVADAALYAAKQQGRNRVNAAPLRNSAPVILAKVS